LNSVHCHRFKSQYNILETEWTTSVFKGFDRVGTFVVEGGNGPIV